MRARSTLPLLAPFLLAACATTAQQAESSSTSQATEDRLIGTWESVTRGPGGVGITMLFAPERGIKLAFGAMVDGGYKLVGDQFTVLGIDGNKPETQTLFLTSAGDTAIFFNGNASQKFIRMGTGTQADSIVGKWWYLHYTGVPGYNEYTPDGRMRVRIPSEMFTGSYRVSGNKLTIRTTGGPNRGRDAPFTLRGDTLTLHVEGYHEMFLRARPLIP